MIKQIILLIGLITQAGLAQSLQELLIEQASRIPSLYEETTTLYTQMAQKNSTTILAPDDFLNSLHPSQRKHLFKQIAGSTLMNTIDNRAVLMAIIQEGDKIDSSHIPEYKELRKVFKSLKLSELSDAEIAKLIDNPANQKRIAAGLNRYMAQLGQVLEKTKGSQDVVRLSKYVAAEVEQFVGKNALKGVKGSTFKARVYPRTTVAQFIDPKHFWTAIRTIF